MAGYRFQAQISNAPSAPTQQFDVQTLTEWGVANNSWALGIPGSLEIHNVCNSSAHRAAAAPGGRARGRIRGRRYLPGAGEASPNLRAGQWVHKSSQHENAVLLLRLPCAVAYTPRRSPPQALLEA